MRRKEKEMCILKRSGRVSGLSLMTSSVLGWKNRW